MPQEYDITLRLTTTGQVDTAYYEAKAIELRNEEIARVTKAMLQWVKGMFKFERIPHQGALFGH